MKKIIIIMLSIILCGCTHATSNKNTVKNNSEKEAIVELQPGKGAVKKIPMQDIFDKMENKETFVVMLSQTYCNACLSFFMETDSYTEEIGLTLWDIILDDEKTSEEENLQLKMKNLVIFQQLPLYIILKMGL